MTEKTDLIWHKIKNPDTTMREKIELAGELHRPKIIDERIENGVKIRVYEAR